MGKRRLPEGRSSWLSRTTRVGIREAAVCIAVAFCAPGCNHAVDSPYVGTWAGSEPGVAPGAAMTNHNAAVELLVLELNPDGSFRIRSGKPGSATLGRVPDYLGEWKQDEQRLVLRVDRFVGRTLGQTVQLELEVGIPADDFKKHFAPINLSIEDGGAKLREVDADGVTIVWTRSSVTYPDP